MHEGEGKMDEQQDETRSTTTFRDDGSVEVRIPWLGRWEEVQRVMELRRRYEAVTSEAARPRQELYESILRDLFAAHGYHPKPLRRIGSTEQDPDAWERLPWGGWAFVESSQAAAGALFGIMAEFAVLQRYIDEREADRAFAEYHPALSCLVYGEQAPARTPEEMREALERARQDVASLSSGLTGFLASVSSLETQVGNAMDLATGGMEQRLLGILQDAVNAEDSRLAEVWPNVFVRSGKHWLVQFAKGKRFSVADEAGMQYVWKLLHWKQGEHYFCTRMDHDAPGSREEQLRRAAESSRQKASGQQLDLSGERTLQAAAENWPAGGPEPPPVGMHIELGLPGEPVLGSKDDIIFLRQSMHEMENEAALLLKRRDNEAMALGRVLPQMGRKCEFDEAELERLAGECWQARDLLRTERRLKKLRADLQGAAEEIKKHAGFAGRPKRFNSEETATRDRLRMAIGRAIETLGDPEHGDPKLGLHLNSSIEVGYFLVYFPRDHTVWRTK